MHALADAGRVEEVEVIERQVARVAHLPADGAEAHKGIHARGVDGHRGRLEVLEPLAQPHPLADEAELLLNRLKGRDLGRRRIQPQEVPYIEAGEVLHRPQELVAADFGAGRTRAVVSAGATPE